MRNSFVDSFPICKRYFSPIYVHDRHCCMSQLADRSQIGIGVFVFVAWNPSAACPLENSVFVDQELERETRVQKAACIRQYAFDECESSGLWQEKQRHSQHGGFLSMIFSMETEDDAPW